jgi:hypothetical protein
MQSIENAWTYLALKQAEEMALQLLHPVAGYWFWRKKTMATLVLDSFPCFFLLSSLLFPSFSVLLSFFFFLFSQ